MKGVKAQGTEALAWVSMSRGVDVEGVEARGAEALGVDTPEGVDGRWVGDVILEKN